MDDQRELPEAENSDVDSSGSSSDENNITVIPAADRLIVHQFDVIDLTALDSDEEAMDDEGGRSSHVAVRRVRFSATAEADLPGPSRVLVTPDLDVRPGEATAVRYSYRLSAVERGGPYGSDISVSSLSSDSEDDLPGPRCSAVAPDVTVRRREATAEADLPGPSCALVAPDVAVRPREAVAEADLPGPSRTVGVPLWPSSVEVQQQIWKELNNKHEIDIADLKPEDFVVEFGTGKYKVVCPVCGGLSTFTETPNAAGDRWTMHGSNFYKHLRNQHRDNAERGDENGKEKEKKQA